jgi:hypothetical protein
MSRGPNKFKPGDIIRVVRGASKDWIQPIPVVVMRYWQGRDDLIDLRPLHGEKITKPGFSPYCFAHDCEFDVFLNAAHRAVRDA